MNKIHIETIFDNEIPVVKVLPVKRAWDPLGHLRDQLVEAHTKASCILEEWEQYYIGLQIIQHIIVTLEHIEKEK